MARLPGWTAAALLALAAADYRPPAESRPATARPGSPSILPGGRVIAPAGKHYRTGPSPITLAIHPKGSPIVAANTGLDRLALTVVTRDKEGWHVEQLRGEDRDAGGPVVPAGLAFEDNSGLFASEGTSGLVQLIDSRSGRIKQTYDLNQGEFRESHAGDLAFDRATKRLYVLDRANGRLVTFDTKARKLAASAATGSRPTSLAMAPGGKRIYVASVDALAAVDAAAPGAIAAQQVLRWAAPPAGLHATAERVFVSNTDDDSVSVFDATSLASVSTIPIRLSGLEAFRGVAPAGLHYDAASKWLLVACAGINAIAVIEPSTGKVLGLIPTAWHPTRVEARDGTVWVACRKGFGTGANASRTGLVPGLPAEERRQGALVSFVLPDASELRRHTATVFAANGFNPHPGPPPLPEAIEHVVLIVKENRTFDEVLGDMEVASNGPVAGLPILARLGKFGTVNNRRGEFQTRLGLRNISVTPNHHGLALRFAFSDNFYADSETNTEGHLWLAGAYPDGRGEFPAEGPLWRHLERHGVSYRRSGEFDMNVSDQRRASEFIRDIEENFVKPGRPLPRLLVLRLPNDHMADARPGEGYPFPGSFVADNDYALGRVVEYLSLSPWWPKLAIFVTEDDATGGLDHIDSHRTVLLAISPYAKRNYVSHVNSSFPGLLKTVLRLLNLPPMNLFDATASDLADCFQPSADVEPYRARPVPVEIFDAEQGER